MVEITYNKADKERTAYITQFDWSGALTNKVRFVEIWYDKNTLVSLGYINVNLITWANPDRN